MSKVLTAAAVERYRPGSERRLIKDGGALGLYLVIQPSGHKSWMARFRRPGGKIGKLALGPVDLSGRELEGAPEIGQPLSLAAARQLVAEVHRQRQLGADVVADNNARRRRRRVEAEERSASTFGAVVRSYVDEHARRHTRNWHETARMLGLNYGQDGGEPEHLRGSLVERWAERPIREVSTHDVWSVVDEARRHGVPGLGVRGSGPSDSRARLLLAALSSMFSWARRSRRVDANPCAGVHRAGSAARERVLTADEVRYFWRATDEIGEPFGQLLKLLLLTGARLREVTEMRPEELGGDRAVWSLPGSRTKNGRPHVVPLAPLCQEIIASVRTVEADPRFVFTTTGTTPVGGFSRIKDRLDALMLRAAREERGATAAVPPWRLHDLRRTAVTGMAEIGVAPHVVELVVNHVSGYRAGVAGIYNKSELMAERRAALERWANHVVDLVGGRQADNVVTFKGGRT
jgi:integrase